MDLLDRLSKQATELWQKQSQCKDDGKRALLLKQYKEIYGKYLKHAQRLTLALVLIWVSGRHPDSINVFWKKIAMECGFKYLSPLQWRHSFATIGALHLHD
jgi:integrase